VKKTVFIVNELKINVMGKNSPHNSSFQQLDKIKMPVCTIIHVEGDVFGKQGSSYSY
jgi:hypothetical protein